MAGGEGLQSRLLWQHFTFGFASHQSFAEQATGLLAKRLALNHVCGPNTYLLLLSAFAALTDMYSSKRWFLHIVPQAHTHTQTHVRAHMYTCTHIHTHMHQFFSGMCHTVYSYNTPYRIQRVFYRIEQIRPYYTIAKFAFFGRLGNFRPNIGLSLSFYAIMYVNNILSIGK